MGLLNYPVLLSAGRVLAIATVIVLWVVAMLDIKGYLSKEIFTVAQLLSMAAGVSVMAVITLATLNAAFPASWTGISGSNEPYRGSSMHPKCKGVKAGCVEADLPVGQCGYARSDKSVSETACLHHAMWIDHTENVLQRVASTLTCPQVDVTSADRQTLYRDRTYASSVWVMFSETRCKRNVRL